MKLSVFKKLIREVIREELDYSFSRLRKELNEIVVKSNTSNMSKARSKSSEDKSMKNIVKASTKNVAEPKTPDNVLNQLLKETAQSDDWKTVEGAYRRDVFSEYTYNVTFAMVTESDSVKEFLSIDNEIMTLQAAIKERKKLTNSYPLIKFAFRKGVEL